MAKLRTLSGWCTAFLSLAMLGTIQLIYASSELSYWLQIGVAALLAGCLSVMSARVRPALLAATIAALALLMAMMPVELAIFVFSPTEDSAGPRLIGPGPDPAQYLLGVAMLWAFYGLLLGWFGAAVRASKLRAGQWEGEGL